MYKKITEYIEFYLVLLGLPINFIWEMVQMPLFVLTGDSSLANYTLICLQASIGDVLILLVMYWCVVVTTKTRTWMFHLNPGRLISFIAIGILLTIVLEAVSVNLLQRWDYSELMPTVPVLGTGLAPILQWLFIPLLLLWLLRRRRGLG